MAGITVESRYLSDILVGDLNVKWSARGDRILRYYIDFRHRTLNLHRELGAPDLSILQEKANALLASWDEKTDKHNVKTMFADGKAEAERLTVQAELERDQLANILSHALGIDDAVDWAELRRTDAFTRSKKFDKPRPQIEREEVPTYEAPKITFWNTLFGKKASLIQQAEETHSVRMEEWQERETARKEAHDKAIVAYELENAAFLAKHAEDKAAHEAEVAEHNRAIEDLIESLREGGEEAVMEHASLVLEASDYHGLIEKEFVLDYRVQDKTLLVEYELPNPEHLPTVKTVRFVRSTGEFKETELAVRAKKDLFENTIYQIALRTIHEVLEADDFENIVNVAFNGFVTAINPANGLSSRNCILSVLCSRAEFEKIDLAHVEPKACFKALSGVSAASLAALAPIPPIISIDRSDRRFVEGRDIADTLDASVNLAAMDWEDFEHLIRELFEKEFNSRGGEVKVTQSSRDEGVDAIAFDPDPISGGKIVIQAKRYTRTVGVAAVRDLYGTVMNEGATKGILVTTSDFGPDAHKFAASKPLSLLNGANLLHLLRKHSHEARIDLAEAREALG
ncbi:restriction endonuclease [Pelagerythrobacter aerophilus]